MQFKTYMGKTVTVDGEITKAEKAKIKKAHGNKYKKIYTIQGKRAKLDYLVECKDHGWFTITKKNFKKGANCKSCANAIKNQKIKETINKDKLQEITKTCGNCSKTFKVPNRAKKRDRLCCSNFCSHALRYRTIVKRNKSVDFRAEHSARMKEEYKNGTRQPTKGRSSWIEYKGIKVQGTFELLMCKALDTLLEEGRILVWEYTNDRIQYNHFNGGVSSYLLDFKVYLSPEIFFYIETKGFAVDNDLLKWRSVVNRGFPLKVFYQRSHAAKIEADPKYILDHKYFLAVKNHVFTEQNDFKLFKADKGFQ